MKRLTFLLLALALAGCNWISSGPATNPDPNHTHADFAVWVNGKQLDFSDAKYMTTSKTGEGETGMRKYLHMHDGDGHVIHRHKPGLKFGDFLRSLGFDLRSVKDGSGTCFVSPDKSSVCDDYPQKKWEFYVNGKAYALQNAPGLSPLGVANEYVFADGDTLLLTYGATAQEIQTQLKSMTDNACLYSRTCPERGKPPTENCIADPEVPCKEVN